MSSYRAGKEYVSLYLRSHFPKGSKCLDVGCCEGFWFDMLSDWFDMDGVEVWRPNVQQYLLFDKYTNLFVKNITEFNYPYDYDVIIFGDIIEHLSVEEAQVVLKTAQSHAKEVIVAVPFLYPQGEKNGNKYEIHKQADLTEEIFAQRYPDFVQLWPNTRPFPLTTPFPYGYYKLSQTEWNIDKMNSFAVGEIYGFTENSRETTTDYLKLMRGCCDYLIMATTQRADMATIAPDIIPYYRLLKNKVIDGTLPSFLRFWKDYYYILTFIKDAPIEEKKEVLLQRFSPNITFEESKYLFDIEGFFIDWALEYACGAAEMYYCKDIATAKKLNDKALEINPNQEIAKQNAPFYVQQ